MISHLTRSDRDRKENTDVLALQKREPSSWRWSGRGDWGMGLGVGADPVLSSVSAGAELVQSHERGHVARVVRVRAWALAANKLGLSSHPQ